MIKFILLGALQGITEFLPISSSGHLVIAQHLLKINKDVVFLDTLLHMGTILSILTFFLKDICSALKNIKTIGYIALVTLITGVIGITFKHTFESFFDSLRYVAIFLVINGVILALTKLSRDRSKEPRAMDSALIGLAQGIAIAPGISRSGSTIATLLFRGIKKEEAFKFSFIASIPAIAGAFLLEAKDAPGLSLFGTKNLIAGVATSYLFGLMSLALLSKVVKNKKLHFFGYYCFILGVSLLFFLRK